MANNPMEASLDEAIEYVKDNIMSNINCHNIGRVISYNAEKCTAQIEVMQHKQWYSQTFSGAIISDVPIVTFGTKGSRITMPNPVGSYAVLLFLDRNIDNFLETGESYLPSTDRMHSMSDCIALLTINSGVDSMPTYDENALTLSNEKIYLQLFNDNKIKIANEEKSLATLIQTFIDACKDITTVNGGPLTEDSKRLFTEVKEQFKELLKE